MDREFRRAWTETRITERGSLGASRPNLSPNDEELSFPATG
jgi:hypothetical protein